MNTTQRRKLNETDVQGALAALKRAARRARQIAVQTKTAIVVRRHGALQRVDAARLVEEQPDLS